MSHGIAAGAGPFLKHLAPHHGPHPHHGGPPFGAPLGRLIDFPVAAVAVVAAASATAAANEGHEIRIQSNPYERAPAVRNDWRPRRRRRRRRPTREQPASQANSSLVLPPLALASQTRGPPNFASWPPWSKPGRLPGFRRLNKE
ncbi:NAD-specific glutamate dehydrogenase [Tolypocladium paradoxum]|uniref:NAD-specific glutamate dehydrogenase n=1 Tax=Tolypocladium paradoxum TaxID=94208 RepID=A0A2S4KS62_9HYPO|nr:NAD-specific glutamate dehydrogenase [Tolypocladium paradoxum]